jgi:muconolactone delta-isomerase
MRKMKFIVIGTQRDVLPPVSVMRQVIEADKPVIEQQKKAGKLLEMYWVPGWGRGISIMEAKSTEEIFQNISEMPCSILMNYEVYPLANYDEVHKMMTERLKAMEKMMTVPPK